MVWISKTMLKRSSRGQQAVGTNYSWMKKKPVRFQSAALSSRQIWDPLWCYPLPGGKKIKIPTGAERAALTAASSLCLHLSHIQILVKVFCVTKTPKFLLKYTFFFPPQLERCNWISDFLGGDGISRIGVKCHSFLYRAGCVFLMLTEKEKIANVS